MIALSLFSLGLLPILVDQVARENLIRRAPLYRAAVDLAEHREDASTEDALLSAATANPAGGDEWLLLGMYAERAGDHPRAVFAYGKAIQTNPKENRAFVNRGNVHFAEGDFSEAIADYEEASRIAPDAVESFYNLSVARAEIYDFKGQEAARARALQVSSRAVDVWSSNPPLERVVPAPYPVARARSRVRARMAETANPGRSSCRSSLRRGAWPPGALSFSRGASAPCAPAGAWRPSAPAAAARSAGSASATGAPRSTVAVAFGSRTGRRPSRKPPAKRIRASRRSGVAGAASSFSP